MNISDFLTAIPANYELYAALFIIACKIVTVLVPPPSATSKFLPVFRVISMLALNIGWATNRIQSRNAPVVDTSHPKQQDVAGHDK